MQKTVEVLFALFVVVVFSERKLLPCTLDRPKPPPSHPHTCLGKPKPIMMTGPNAPRSNCILCRRGSRRPQPHMSAWCMHLKVHVTIWMLEWDACKIKFGVTTNAWASHCCHTASCLLRCSTRPPPSPQCLLNN